MLIDNLSTQLASLAQIIRLDLFTFIGSIIEEIIAPIPSPLIMTTAGALAVAQHKSLLYMAWIIITGAVGKTIASMVIYWVVDKGEDLVLLKYGKYFGISHAQVEKLGKYFSGSKWDMPILFLLRSVPFVPTFYISAVAGFIKLNFTDFTFMTFLGSIVRNVFYILVGVVGLEQLGAIMKAHPTYTNLIAAVSIALLGVAFWLVNKYRAKLEVILEAKIGTDTATKEETEIK